MKVDECFGLEQRTEAFSGPVHVYKHRDHGMRVVFAQLGGPLASAQIVVPTGTRDDGGRAHTLEHLVFCGSRAHPRRGFLDTLATRSLSTGSNAYTTDDHTCYQITTAGAEGLARVLPVLLDHVLHPTLSDHQFMTEVFHVDGHAREQGVVFCEMAGREHSEADVVDLRIRSRLFPNTTYAFECGGLTSAIRNLSNDDIRSYHSLFYKPDAVTILICGSVNHQLIFDALKTVDLGITTLLDYDSTTVDDGIIFTLPASNTPAVPCEIETVAFPSQDDFNGSCMFAWRGPMSHDFRTIVGLDIVLRYLQDTSASPLYQAFVENDEPWAAEVDYDIKSYLQTAIVLYFSGVKCKEGENEDGFESMDEDAKTDDGNEEWEDEDKEEDGDVGDWDSQDEADDAAVVDPALFKERLVSLLRAYTVATAFKRSDLERTIGRYRRKIKEAFEEDPHEVVANYIMPDIVRFRLSSATNLRSSAMELSRGELFGTLESLWNEPLEYWAGLVKHWLVEQTALQIVAKPSRQLAHELAKTEAAALQSRTEAFGADGLVKLGQAATEAFEANKVDLPESLLASFPDIPDVRKLPNLVCSLSIHDIAMHPQYKKRRALNQAQIVRTETLFTHCRIALNIGQLPEKMRPYLVLFQELVFQSPIAAPGKGEVSYQNAVKKTSEIFVSNEASVGFGNDMWSCTWLAETFMMAISCEEEQFDEALDWMLNCLFFTKFTKERVISCVQKLLSDLMDIKRDGSSVSSAVTTRLTSAVKKQGLSENITTGATENDLAISIFVQEAFLKSLQKKLKFEGAKGLKAVVDSLHSLKAAIVTGVAGNPGFVQLGIPHLAGNTDDAVLTKFLAKWDKQNDDYNILIKLRPATDDNGKSVNVVAFPFPRSPLDIASLETKKFGHGVVVPVEGATASYLSVIVPCDVLKNKDYYAVTLLAELLSRAEGPLYTSIRGKGYAYDASLMLSTWSGQLTFDVSESSEPQLSVAEFFRILKGLDSASGFAQLVSPFNVETARASVMYRVVTENSTGGGCIGSSLRRCLQVRMCFPSMQ
ncbi:hypothetical protein BC830DRAFT_1195746 [Chytriomyces sp. MP71]|nr:hypothetical protein BC830DRAFT_1195746 [Chytriomyces sp. MP71]